METGDILRGGRYEIQRLLRCAPAKSVYLAYDRVLDRPVVVDVFSNNSIMPNGMTVGAWEARVLGKLDDHQNIATAQDYWEDDQTAVMVSRYLSGGTLHDRIAGSQEASKGLTVDSILQVAAEMACALMHIHGRRILHRDLQPRNALFDEWGTVHLVDFDTAALLDDPEMSDLSNRPVTDYMAPEIIEGQSAGERSDLYSLGATIYEMAFGHPPVARIRAKTSTEPGICPASSVERDDLPPTLRELVSRLLAPEPGQRPTSAAEVVEVLEGLRMARAAQETPASPPAGGSQSLPAPDPAELRASAGAKAAEYGVGDVLDDRFEILGILGRGGFSKVYRVRDHVEGEERALKLFDTPAGYEAVRREIGALRKIHHPKVVEVFWADKTDVGDWYLITEFIEGESLEEFVTGEKHLRDREAVDVVLDVLDACVAFHPDSGRLKQLDSKRREADLSEDEFGEWMELVDKGLVHRDIKPFNVILTRSGAKLLDFNITSRVGDPVRTLSGTPPYQPPDADFTRWDVSTDLFAIGVTLYQLLCDGRHPYPNSRPMIDEPVIDPRTTRSDLNPQLAEFLIRACAPAHDDRFSTAAEMQSALRKIRADL